MKSVRHELYTVPYNMALVQRMVQKIDGYMPGTLPQVNRVYEPIKLQISGDWRGR